MKWFVVACTLLPVVRSCQDFGVLWSEQAAAQRIRVDFRLVGYYNPGSVLADGITKCKGSAPCDLKLTGEVDTTSCALNAWPDQKSVSKWATIFEKKSTDTDRVGKIVFRDICGGDFRKSNLRVQAVDVNGLFSSKEIQQFDCLTSSSTPDILSSEARATWSDPKLCSQKYTNPRNARLIYQWRAYKIPRMECGKKFG